MDTCHNCGPKTKWVRMTDLFCANCLCVKKSEHERKAAAYDRIAALFAEKNWVGDEFDAKTEQIIDEVKGITHEKES